MMKREKPRRGLMSVAPGETRRKMKILKLNANPVGVQY